MKTKKTKKANLEKKRTIFFQVGLILTLSAILAAFEWQTSFNYKMDYKIQQVYDDNEIIPPVTMPRAEPPPKVEAPALTFTQVGNDVVIEDEPFFIETEDNWDDPININSDFGERDEGMTEIDYPIVEIMPRFMGKEAPYFRNYIVKNIRFPERAREEGIKGKVIVSFVVDKTGKVTKIELLRGVHPSIDQAVIDIMRNSPIWEPGIQQGKYVNVKFSIAIAFDLI